MCIVKLPSTASTCKANCLVTVNYLYSIYCSCFDITTTMNVPDLTTNLHDFPWPTIQFHDFPGVENKILELNDFQGQFSIINLCEPCTHQSDNTVEQSRLKANICSRCKNSLGNHVNIILLVKFGFGFIFDWMTNFDKVFF